tara:strand:- start:80 stop:1141 length:1062 start_codon:yes stop_codon:yes gene_type:complete
MLLFCFFIFLFFFVAVINGSFELIILAIFLLGAFFTKVLIDTSFVKTKGRKKPQKNCNPIKDIYLKSDDEIIEKLQKLSRPFYSILDQLISNQKKWMPDEEKDEYESLISDIEYQNFFPMGHEELKWACEDYKEFELSDFLDHILSCDIANEAPKYTGVQIIDETRESYRSVNLEILRIIWSFFGIEADLFRVNKLFKMLYVQDFSFAEKAEWESYQKTFFYHDKKQVKRIMDLCLSVFNQNAELFADKYQDEELIDDLEITETDNLSEYGYVYLIRNKDIYKIGITQNMLQRMDQLKPDELLDSVRCSNFRELEKEIHKEFKVCRIPQTEYFRLDKKQITEIHKIFKDKAIK